MTNLQEDILKVLHEFNEGWIDEEILEEKLRTLGKNITIQGEIIGEGVQGNKYKLKGQKLYHRVTGHTEKFKSTRSCFSLSSLCLCG